MLPPFVNKKMLSLLLFLLRRCFCCFLCVYFLSNVVRFRIPQSVAWSWNKDIQYWFWTPSGKYLSQSPGITGSTKSRNCKSPSWWNAKYCEHIEKKSVSLKFPQKTAFSFLDISNQQRAKRGIVSLDGTKAEYFLIVGPGVRRIVSRPNVDDPVCDEINIRILGFTSLFMAPLNPPCRTQLGRTSHCKPLPE